MGKGMGFEMKSKMADDNEEEGKMLARPRYSTEFMSSHSPDRREGVFYAFDVKPNHVVKGVWIGLFSSAQRDVFADPNNGIVVRYGTEGHVAWSSPTYVLSSQSYEVPYVLFPHTIASKETGVRVEVELDLWDKSLHPEVSLALLNLGDGE